MGLAWMMVRVYFPSDDLEKLSLALPVPKIHHHHYISYILVFGFSDVSSHPPIRFSSDQTLQSVSVFVSLVHFHIPKLS